MCMLQHRSADRTVGVMTGEARSALPAPHGRVETEREQLSRDTHLNLLLTTNRFGAEIDSVLAVHGLSMPQFIALWVLALSDEPDGIAQGVIADGLLTRASDVSRLVDRLVTGGLAERIPSPNDGRVTLVRMTSAGRSVMIDAFHDVTEFHRQEWSGLTMIELGDLNRLLLKALWGGVVSIDAPTA